MIVKPNFRALFKGFSPLKCQPKGVSAKFNSTGNVTVNVNVNVNVN